MTEQNNNTEHFDYYLSGKMSKEERDVFELKLTQDSEFNAAFELHKVLVNGIKEAGRGEVKKMLQKEGAVKYWGNLWGQKWTIASAAIFIMFFAMYLVIDKLPQTFNKGKMEKTEAVSKDDSEDLRGEKASKNDKDSAVFSDKDSDDKVEAPLFDSKAKVEEIEEDIELSIEIEETLDAEVNKEELVPESSAGNEMQRSKKIEDSKTTPPQTPEKKKEQIETTFKEIPGEPEITVASSGKMSDTTFMIPVISTDTSAKSDSINVMIVYMSSPLNSRIFKYTTVTKNVIEVYGIPNKTLKPLGVIKDEVYLISEKTIYRFHPIPEYTPLVVETRKEVIKQLMNK